MVKVLSIISIFIFALLASEVYAINLGSVVKNDFVKINHDESAKFTILLWNSENEPYDLKLEVKDAPKNWLVIIDPDVISISKETGNEFISLMNDKVKATSVNVFVKPSNNEVSGKYFVKVSAIPLISFTELSILPERVFKFTIDLEGSIENGVKDGVSSETIEDFSKTEDKSTKTYNKNYTFYFIPIIFILLVSFVLYKIV